MNIPQVSNKQLLALLQTYWQWRWVWFSTTAGFALLGLIYAIFLKEDIWVASQGLIVRDEANGSVMQMGRFQSQTEMKAAQETVLEMAHNTQVIHGALQTVGREPTWFGMFQSTKPPSSLEVEQFAQGQVEVRAPRGAELGTTEVIYVDVKATSQERALKLNKALCDHLENQLQLVRKARADGVIKELTTASASARAILERSTERLREIEAATGADLSDLRGLTDSVSGGSNSRQVLDVIKSELRSAELAHQQLQIDLEMARSSFENPDELLLAPTRLLNDNPGLRKLREGLADAAIASSQRLGKYNRNHPSVIASLETEARIREQLRVELGTAVESLKREMQISSQRISQLTNQQVQLEERLARLASIRAEYSNIAREVAARSEQLQRSEGELAQAIASRDAAMTSSLVTRLNEPLVGEKPIGPGGTTILMGATVCGLFFGLGIVFLLTPLDLGITYGRRQNDFTKEAGRRASDQQAPSASSLSSQQELLTPSFKSETPASAIVQPPNQPLAAQQIVEKAFASIKQKPSIEPMARDASANARTSNLTPVSSPAGSLSAQESSVPKPARESHVPAQPDKRAAKTMEMGISQKVFNDRSLSTNAANTPSKSTAPGSPEKPGHLTEESISTAQAVIAAALQCAPTVSIQNTTNV